MSDTPKRRGRPPKQLEETVSVPPANPEPNVTKHYQMYESRLREPSPFLVAGIRPTRDFSTGRLLWKVPTSDVARFEQHHHYVNNRVRRTTD